MKISLSHGDGWPTPQQILLLRACFLPGAHGLAAWQQWKTGNNFDQIEGASFRLIPMLYSNLRNEIGGDPLAAQLKGIYRHAWSRNQLLFHEGLKVVASLRQKNIPTLLLKGVALVAQHYHDAGLRPMNDFDLFVSPQNAPDTFVVLEKMGWQYAEPVPIRKIINCSHAAKFNNGRGQQIDVHWHLLPEGRQLHTDDEIWSGAVETEFSGSVVNCINPTDLFFHVCAHGTVGDPIPPIRWICDSWKIISTSTIDWERFLQTARKRKLSLSMEKSLAFLRNEFSMSIPSSIIQQLGETPSTWIEKWECKIKSKPRGVSGAVPLHCLNYFRESSGKSLLEKVAGTAGFFQRVWGLKRKREIPGYVARKIWSRTIG